MSDYTTITVSKGVKEDLESDIEDGETWNEYLQRLSEKPEHAETESSTEVSEEGVDEIKVLLQDLAEERDVDQSSVISDSTQDIDYDHVREIVREEVRRALEEIVRYTTALLRDGKNIGFEGVYKWILETGFCAKQEQVSPQS